MGLFKKVKKAVGGIFDGIMKGIDKLTGGKFSKLMGNKWVKGALMAVGVVTGGIAIANGVMAAGQAGIGEAAKAFASNMTAETGKNLVSTVIEGGKQFIGGVSNGLKNPMQSDAGQALSGMFEGSVGNIAGTPTTGAEELTAATVESGAAEAMNASAGVDPSQVLDAGSVDRVAGGIPPSPDAASQVAQMNGSVPPSATDPNTYSLPDTANGLNPANGELNFVSGEDAMRSMGRSFDQGGDALGRALTQDPTAKPGLLRRLAASAEEYATSPMGMHNLGSMAQGWASGQAMQERWDQMEKAENERRKSWTGGGFKMPRFGTQ